MISRAPASAQVPVAMPNAHCLMRTGSAPISASASLVLCHGLDRAAGERAGKIQRETGDQHQRHAEGNQHPHGYAHVTERNALADVCGLHHALVHAEAQDQHHLHDERNAEKEGKPAQAGVGAAAFEGGVIEAVNGESGQEKDRRKQDAGEQRIETEAAEKIRAVRAEHQKGRVCDLRHVKKSERNRQADAHARHRSSRAARRR